MRIGPRADLPIWDIHERILAALRESNRLVLAAPTGSGKTTQVPQMLLDAGLARGKKIVVLQPRRVAARTVAARVAWERGVRLGAEVGYQIRFDDTTSPGTVISFVTEGILLRWLQDDPALRSTGAVLFDEFHERNLLSDASLALVKRLQETARAGFVARGDVGDPRGRAAGEVSWPAERRRPGREVSDACFGGPDVSGRGALRGLSGRVVRDRAGGRGGDEDYRRGEAGDILIFMPGMGEINATIQAVQGARLGEPVALIPLHGDLPPEDQDRAFAPCERRKIVVATNVAETSVTIDGIRHVIDGGLARVARYDSERGINTLHLEEISRASAEQRKGRSGTDRARGLSPALDGERTEEPARAQHPRDSTGRFGGGRPAAPFFGHPPGGGVRLAGPSRRGGRGARGKPAPVARRFGGSRRRFDGRGRRGRERPDRRLDGKC